MINKINKIIISILTSIVLFFSLIPYAMAQAGTCVITAKPQGSAILVTGTGCTAGANYNIDVTDSAGKPVIATVVKVDASGKFSITTDAITSPKGAYKVNVTDPSGNAIGSATADFGTGVSAGATPSQALSTPTGPLPWYSQDPFSWYAKVYGGDKNEIFGERYTAAQVQWVFYGVFSFFINLALGFNPTAEACIAGITTGDVTPCTQLRSSLTGVSDMFNVNKDKTLIGMFFEDRGFSGITYVKDLGRKFRLIPEAKAQTGFGYAGALGSVPAVQDAWAAVRDVSYTLFVVVIIAFAFMIMFRVKLSPQLVVSVQSALPKVAIGLILVTFSYAIAGFLIDIMYVFIGAISLIFSSFKVFGVAFDVNGILNSPASPSPSATGYFTLLTQGPTFLGLKTGVFGMMIMYIVNYFLAWIIVVFVGIGKSFLGTGGFGGGAIIGVLTGVVGLLGLLVIFIMSIINFFKVIILLAKAFATIILLTVFAPIQFTLGTFIPGLGFSAWVKSFASKLAIFPAVGVLFIFALWFLQLAVVTITNAPTVLDAGNPSFAQGWPPLLGGSPQLLSLAFLLASIAVFFMIPSAGKMVESFVAGKGLSTDLGGSLAIPAGLAGAAASERVQRFQNVNKEQTPFQNARDAGKRGTAEYLLSELTRRLAGGK